MFQAFAKFIILLSFFITLAPVESGAIAAPYPVQNTSDFVGTFSDGNLKLVLEADRSGYLQLSGASYKVSITSIQGNQLKGSFAVEDSQFDFEAKLQGSQLTLVSGGTTYQLTKKQKLVNPLSKPPVKDKDQIKEEPAPRPKTGFISMEGDYKRDDASLSLRKIAEEHKGEVASVYVGQINRGQMYLDVKIITQLKDSVMIYRGELSANGEVYELDVDYNGKTLVIELDEAVFEFDKVVNSQKGSGSQTPTAPVQVPGNYKKYRHVLGLELMHPQDWKVAESPLGIQLTPPNALVGPQGPKEFYTISVSSAGANASGLNDPKLQQFLTSMLQQSVPSAQPLGQPREFNQQGIKGLILEWNAQTPIGKIFIRIYMREIEGYLVGLSAFGEEAQVKTRVASLENIFVSNKVSLPITDPRMAGTWYNKSYSQTGSVGDNLNRSSTTTVHLHPNGVAQIGSNSTFSGTIGGTGVRPRGSFSGGATSDPSLGRWAVENDKVYLLWNSGASSILTFHVQGTRPRREALLTDLQGNKTLWTEYNE